MIRDSTGIYKLSDRFCFAFSEKDFSRFGMQYNCKISIFGEEMRGTPGVAAKVFSAVSKVKADIRMITTSEVDISLLVVKADADMTVVAIREIFA